MNTQEERKLGKFYSIRKLELVWWTWLLKLKELDRKEKNMRWVINNYKAIIEICLLMRFTFEQKTFYFTKFFIKKITSKIFTPASSSLLFAEASTSMTEKLFSGKGGVGWACWGERWRGHIFLFPTVFLSFDIQN